MARLIDADALIEKAKHEAEGMKGEYKESFAIYVEWLVEKMPPIEERKTGKWNRLRSDTFHCNFCGTTFIVIQGENNMNYCPNCGARMEGEQHG